MIKCEMIYTYGEVSNADSAIAVMTCLNKILEVNVRPW